MRYFPTNTHTLAHTATYILHKWNERFNAQLKLPFWCLFDLFHTNCQLKVAHNVKRQTFSPNLAYTSSSRKFKWHIKVGVCVSMSIDVCVVCTTVYSTVQYNTFTHLLLWYYNFIVQVKLSFYFSFVLFPSCMFAMLSQCRRNSVVSWWISLAPFLMHEIRQSGMEKPAESVKVSWLKSIIERYELYRTWYTSNDKR